MKRFLIASHGDFAKEIIKSINMITGLTENMYSLSMNPNTSTQEIKDKLGEIISEGNKSDEFIILTDVLGGSISNVCTEFIGNRVHVITGFNLPMLLEMVVSQYDMNTEELIYKCINQAREGIVHVNEMLKKQE